MGTASDILSKASEQIKNLARPFGEIGLKAENVEGTVEHERKLDTSDLAQLVLDEYDEGESLFSMLFNRMDQDRSFYLGDKVEQWNGSPEGELQLVFNIGAAVIDLFTYILSNNPPYVQFNPVHTDPVSQLQSDFKEEMTKKLFSNAKFHKRFRDSVRLMFNLGITWIYPLWNKDNKDGGPNGTFELSVLNPFSTRVKYSANDYEKIESFTTWKRMSPREIMEKYKYEALPDMEIKFLPKTFPEVSDGMTTVFRRFDKEKILTVINGRLVTDPEKHGLDFVPIQQVNNIIVSNDPHGHSEIERWKGIAQEVNALLSVASEIARDLGYPPILEYNNALGGRKPSKWRGQKIPVRKSDKGEAVSFMINPAQIAPLLNQTKLLIEIFHFVSLMPKAAAGVFEPSITSGFQAKLAMQPATLTTENRKIDWEIAIKELVKMAFSMLKKHDPTALKAELPDKQTFDFDMPTLDEMQVIWPQNLPIDVAREIQNLVAGITNNLTSVHQAIDKYNVMMGMGSPTDTRDYLEQEADMITLTPDRALKVAEVRSKLQEMDAAIQQAEAQMGQLRTQMNDGENPTNDVRALASPLPEEQRTTSQTAESVVPESTGGQIIPPGPATP